MLGLAIQTVCGEAVTRTRTHTYIAKTKSQNVREIGPYKESKVKQKHDTKGGTSVALEKNRVDVIEAYLIPYANTTGTRQQLC